MDAGELLDLLGNENRRRILRLLARKPCYVTEISDYLGVSPKAVIDHLRRLEEADLIESRTDEHRRKYFNIAQHLRLEVTVSPYSFGMKSAYPASPSLDLSKCRHLSLDLRVRERGRAAANGGTAAIGPGDRDTGERAERTARSAADAGSTIDGPGDGPVDIASLASELEELEELERELSLAQRWAQGRIAAVLDRLSAAAEAGEDYLDAELLAALADGPTRTVEVSTEVDVPPPIVEERLRRLERHGLVRRDGERWLLA